MFLEACRRAGIELFVLPTGIIVSAPTVGKPSTQENHVSRMTEATITFLSQ